MELTNQVWNEINQISEHTFSKLKFRKLFNHSCILYGSGLLKLYHKNYRVDKLHILCTQDQYDILRNYLVTINSFIEVATYDKILFMKQLNRDKKLTLVINIVDSSPIKELPSFTYLKIEQIYYDGSLIIHNYMKEFITQHENYNIHYNDDIFKRMRKYVDYGYSFNIIVPEYKISIHNGSKGRYFKRLKYMFTFNIKSKQVYNDK